VDLYVGGTEHAVLHLLYARFWHKVLFDLGYVSTPEPFYKLVNQGLILGETEFSLFQDDAGSPVSSTELEGIEEEATAAGPRLIGYRKIGKQKVVSVRIGQESVEKRGDGFILKGSDGVRVDSRSFKMSKSRGNVVNPDDVIAEYGADALRLYEMFMGPLEQTKPWSMAGVEGVARFLARVWRLVMEENQEGQWVKSPLVEEVVPAKSLSKVVHQTIKKVTEDIEGMRFNTAISQMMICTNALTESRPRPASALRVLVQLLNPFAPHIAEELWQIVGGEGDLAHRPWPEFDPSALIEDEVEIPVQVNGKLRDKVTVPRETDAAAIEALALDLPKVKEHTAGKEIRKVVVVPGKLVNIVAS
jgi:leucyl-tRNA synthetase